MRGLFPRVCAAAALASFLAGCGYTTRPLLPEDVKTVYVAPVKNAIDLSAQTSSTDPFRVYRPGVEVELTNAIVNRFIFDGHLKVAAPEEANALLEAKLTDYRRDPLRYSRGDDVQEVRLTITLDAALYAAGDRKVLWQDRALIGDTTFFLTGPRAVSEDEAAGKAVEDVARRVVEKTLELW